MALIGDGPEAGQWLTDNGNPAGFASNRFEDMDEARRFVASLYAAGASRVYIPQSAIRNDEIEMAQGGPYADALLAEFDPNNCTEIVRIFEREFEREAEGAGDEELYEDGRKIGSEGRLFFWWD